MKLLNGVTRLELVYRVYARQFEDSNLRLAAVREKLLAIFPTAVFIIEEVYSLPLAPDRVAAATDRGLLVIQRGDDSFALYVYGMRVEFRDYVNSEALKNSPVLDEISWAVIRVVSDYPTETIAE